VSTILLSGASGFIGSRLEKALAARGDRVVRLTRRPTAGTTSVHWDAERGQLDAAALAAVNPDIVVNLAGETIAQRWTSERRRRIADSRVNGTGALARAIASLATKPRAFLSGSAIGFYGANRGDEELTESSVAGTGFLATVARDWELAAAPAADAGIRVALLRTSTVLGPGGGALGPLLPVFQFGLGGAVGSGRQWFSWISLEDMVRAIVFLMDSPASNGPFNLASPNPERYATFAKSLGHVLGRPAALPAPAFALKLMFGDMAEETILANQRVVPARLAAAGFGFRHPRMDDALRAELSR
jgi:uncharacterized protein (TIGR01777 family)